MATGFQYSAFQDDAFQNSSGAASGCGFQQQGFQWSAFQNCADAPASTRPYPAPAGGVAGRGGKRKKYVIDGQRVSLTREQLEDTLERLLTRPAAQKAPTLPAAVKPKDRAIVAAFPAYPDLRDMLLAAQQIEAAQALRAVAQRLADEEDERDVEVLLLWG